MFKFTLFLLFTIISVTANNQPSTPGAHKKIPCSNNPKMTFDVYIPKAYATKPQKHFPVLYISSPGGNPGFRRLEKWAEQREFLLICINNSKNGPWDVVDKAQEAVIPSTDYLRKHHCLQFAIGMSGSAWASVRLANKYPKRIAGVFMNCHSGNNEYVTNKHCSVTLVAGKKDKVHAPSFVEGAYNHYKKSGFHTKYECLDMAHKWAPTEKAIENLNYMYDYQKFSNPLLTEKEAAAAYEELEKNELKKIAQNPNKLAALTQLNGFMKITRLMKSKLGTAIYREWAKAATSYIDGIKDSEPAKAYFFLLEPQNAAIQKKIPRDFSAPLAAAVRELSRKKAVVNEINADKKLQSYQRKADRTRNRKSAERLIKTLEEFIEDYTGTRAAKKAQEIINKLKKIKK